MASSKRKQDEKHLKMLRAMVAMSHNKQCFDCHQRGPTYVNMTIGSFVCTSCSGLLRGLNPPHRVKSISMTSFTPDEMEFLRNRGNELCRRVWLGLYDSRTHLEPDSKDENKIRDFMAQKYEKKRYYVAPTEAMYEEAKQQNTPPTETTKKQLGTTLTFNRQNQASNQVKAPSVQVPPQASQPVIRPPAAPQPTSQAADSQPSSQASTQPASQPKSSSAFDLLGEIGGDPFASSGPTPTGGSTPGFANFGSFPSSASVSSTPAAPLTAFPTPAGAPTAAAPSGAPAGFTANFSSATSSAPAPTGGDKYAALADVFSDVSTASPATNGSVFGTTNAASHVHWDGTSSQSGGIFGGSSMYSSSSGSGWGTSLSTAASTSAAPPPQPTFPATVPQAVPQHMYQHPHHQQQAGAGPAVIPGPATTLFSPTNPFSAVPAVSAAPGAPNPFAAPATSMAPPNPFGSGPPNVPPPSYQSTFGQFGTPPSNTGPAFGQFGPGPAPGAGQFGVVPNGAAVPGGWAGAPQQPPTSAFGAPPAAPVPAAFQAHGAGFGSFGGKPPQPPQQAPASGFGGWGAAQQPTANPFMNMAAGQQAVPPRSNSTNPFL